MSEQDAQQSTSEPPPPQETPRLAAEQPPESTPAPDAQPAASEPEAPQSPLLVEIAAPVVEQTLPEPPPDPPIVNTEAPVAPVQPPEEIAIPVIVPQPAAENQPAVVSPVPDSQPIEALPQPNPAPIEPQVTVGFQQSTMSASTEPSPPESPSEILVPGAEPQPVPVVEVPAESPAPASQPVVAEPRPVIAEPQPVVAEPQPAPSLEIPAEPPAPAPETDALGASTTAVPVVLPSAQVITAPTDLAAPAPPTPILEVSSAPASTPQERQVLSPIVEVSSTEKPASEASIQDEAVSAPTSPASVVIIEPIEHHNEVTPLPSPAPTISPAEPLILGSPVVEEPSVLLPPPMVEDLPLPPSAVVEQPLASAPEVFQVVKPAEVTEEPRIESTSFEQQPSAAVVEDPKPAVVINMPQQENNAVAVPASEVSKPVHTEEVKVPEPVTAPEPTVSAPSPIAPPPTPVAPTIPEIVLTKPDAPTSPYDDPNLGVPVTEVKVKIQDPPPKTAPQHHRFFNHLKMKLHLRLDNEKPRKRDRTRAKLFSEGFLSFSLGRRHAVIVKPLLDDASTRPRKAQQKFNAPDNVSRTRLRMKRRGRAGANRGEK